MANNLDDQLVSYFSWIERRVGLPMHRGSDDALSAGSDAEQPGDPDFDAAVRVLHAGRSRATSRPWWAYAGAASLVVGLVVALAVAGSRQRMTSNSDVSTPSVANTAPGNEATGSTLPSTETNVDIAGTLAPGASEILPASPLAGRTDPMAVWTGAQMIVWGGSVPKPTSGETPFDDGAMYDPIARAWTTVSPAPISARSNAATAWTGTEMLIWGGSENGTSLFDGAAYNPTTNTWRELPTFDLAATIRPTTIWTGSEMIVLEGINGSPHGGAYNPSTNTWRTLADPPGRSATPYPQAIWTGTEVIATLTAGLDDAPIIAAYNPITDRWDVIATNLSSGQRPKLLWTGSELLAFAMTDTGGRAWNPVTRTWRSIAAPPTSPALAAQPIWTGALAVFWNGGRVITTYDPTADTWTDTPSGELTRERVDGVRLWANGILLTWAGFVSNPDGTASGANDGIAWRPKTGV